MIERLWTIPGDFWATLGEMAPYLLFGFLLAGACSVAVSARTIERHLGGKGFWPVLKATVVGIPLPLCSCGVIPVGASLRRHGASRGATVAFLISTPQDGVDSVLVTLGLLGPVFAIFRPLVALVSGLLGGALAAGLGGGGDVSSGESRREACDEPCCRPQGGTRLRRALSYGFGALPRDIGRALLVGLLLAAVITAFVPADSLAGILGGGLGAMVLMMVLGIPVYVCATASVPVAAALILKGVSPGAALVFLMTGPATNLAAIATIWRVMGVRTAAVYLVTVAVSAIGAGLVLDAVLPAQDVVVATAMGWMLPGVVRHVCAVALLGVLIVGAVRSRRGGHHHAPDEREQPGDPGATELAIRGMTCDHCRQAVQRALTECDGVDFVVVDLARGRATVIGPAGAVSLRRAVASLGYRAERVRAQTVTPKS